MQKPDAASSGSATAKKRSYDSVNKSDEEDMKDCEEVEGDEEVEGRLGQAPFQDG